MKSRLEILKDWFWGAVWSVGPGIALAVADIIDDVTQYEGPIDWRHVGGRFGMAFLAGLGLYLRKQQAENTALYKMPPDGGLRASIKAAEIESELRGVSQ